MTTDDPSGVPSTPPPRSRIRRGARPAVLIAVGTALYFLTLALALYELDRQHYTGEKAQVVRDNFREIFNLPENFEELARPVFASPTPEGRAEAERRLRLVLREIVDGPTSMYWLKLKDRDGLDIMEEVNRDKPRRMNTFDNNLFIRDFDRTTDLLIKGAGRIVGHYTSPPGVGDIRRLTERYRWISAAMAAVWVLVYYFLYKYLLRPLQRVTWYLERSRAATPELMRSPRGFLEHSYNDIARQALLQQLQGRLGALMHSPGPDERRRVVQDALAFAATSFGLEEFTAAELAGTAPAFTVADTYRHPADGTKPDGTVLVRDAADLSGHETPADQPRFRASGNDFVFLERAGIQMFLAAGKLAPGPDAAFRLTCARQACETLRAGFVTLRAYQQDMARQRSEANIILSRNLGHDLTNIIATGKLDLMAVRQMLSQPLHQIPAARAELLRQSVEGLLETTRFLQEIVNLYRSFSYVKRPQYERHDLNELVAGFLAMFQPTVSKRLTLHRQLQEGIPTLILEPRLLKLALFNVLQNALDAIKRDTRASAEGARITVSTSHDPAAATFTITISDNGPGIRDRAGRLLGPGETGAIFQYGYSTKAEASEGLGLNWVRTIVEDFHHGRTAAENNPGGGARFLLTIRSMEQNEARIGAAGG